MARCGSPSRQRASAATAMPPFVSLRDAADRLEVAVGGGGEAGLDDVDLAARELPRDSIAVRPAPGACSPSRSVVSKTRTRSRGASGWRAVRRRPSGPPRRRGLRRRRRGGLRLARLHDHRVQNGICACSSAPTCSIWWPWSRCRAPGTRRRRPPAGRRSSEPRTPDWMSARTSFIVASTPSATRAAEDVVAVLGRVADAGRHEVQAAAIHQVDDELSSSRIVRSTQLGLAPASTSVSNAALMSAETPPHRSACSPNRSVSVSSLKVVSRTRRASLIARA